eukprot:Protomagalhaensia_sp_Gyna_25__2578@NODE_2466_length_1072_cov_707_851888_g2042_i0_p3_GENE_NODE_2466_length_1072_cov_707_851888_g2042_i0NODE_2466_length_1072_cov_707_851888_g2042_i0_p3_ORF_typecomplete_len126_score7_14UMP1/PF05348_11/2_6e13_NODE_2466_length_1072_cov_707_851888_g2042_i0102479
MPGPTLQNSIPDTFVNGPGLRDVNTKTIGQTVEHIVTEGAHKEEISRLQGLGVIYGLHAPHRLYTERQLVGHQRRLPGTGLPSSMLSLELLLGKEDRCEFGDFGHMPRTDCPNDRLGLHFACENV